MKQESLIFQRRAAREILFFTISRNRSLSEEIFWSQVLPHMQTCLEQEGFECVELTRRTGQEGILASVLVALGLWDKATKVLEQAVAARQEIFGYADFATIGALWDLAKVY
ncbi:hypothetical protein CORC01_03394 [Colletotrichum orchidophilum]|uniref:Uncharacterized protein n=1 Tax=Colletotrichum orchidophilum TaxID=1209926 RepID=A0A1G4BIV9_9PEZI|nr:uncharacterized protein CORC01_03394 [Colletotrichum orchidophilum]OHF01361.1 hypothetical protein CORC01_03394 [Colletotrichum orchidophilum]